MKKVTNLAAAGALLLGSAPAALAGSVTEPGETVGAPSGAPAPQASISAIRRTGVAGTRARRTRVCASISRSWLGRPPGRFSARGYSYTWRGSFRWKWAFTTRPTSPACSIRSHRGNWPGISAMDGASAVADRHQTNGPSQSHGPCIDRSWACSSVADLAALLMCNLPARFP
jgi:hypothetical protein